MKKILKAFLTIILASFISNRSNGQGQQLAPGWITNGLVANYPFNGNANDVSGNGNNGIILDGNFVTDRFGKPSNAFEIPTPNLGWNWGMDTQIGDQFSTNLTLALWFKLPSAGGGILITHGIPGYVDPFISVTQGELTFRASAPQNWLDYHDSSVTESQWHYAVATISGTSDCLYFDGKLVLVGSNPMPSSSGTWKLGPMAGDYDDVRIYSRALNSNEVAQLFAFETDVPVIIQQPSNQVANVGDTVHFAISATASNSFSYQWLKDGKPIAGATNQVLTLTNVQPFQIGYYSVGISNALAGVVSASASLNLTGNSFALWQGLVAYYPFNGNANDASGNGNNGIPQYLSYGNNRFGKTNGAALFGYTSGVNSFLFFGNNSQVSCPGLNSLPNYPITFTFWMNLNAYQTWLSYSGGGIMTIIGKEGSGYLDAAVSILNGSNIYNSGGKQNVLAYLGGPTNLGSQWNGANFSPQLSQWYQVSFTLATDGTQSFYVNGALVSQIISPTSLNCSTDIPFLIGDSSPYGSPNGYRVPFNGYLSDVRIYNRALSSNEVAQLYASETIPPAPQITADVTDLQVVAGSEASLRIKASGSTPLTYQWRQNGTNLLSGVISTLAGNANATFGGDGSNALQASFNSPGFVRTDAVGNIYISDQANNRIRKIAANGLVSTIAGNGVSSAPTNGLYATNTSVGSPYGLAIDNAGTVYFSDPSHSVIRKIDTNGVVTAFAGNGNFGNATNVVMATNAALSCIYGLAVDASGNVYFADSCYNAVRKVGADGILHTVAGNGVGAGYGDGGYATNAALSFPTGVALDGAGNLYIADKENGRVRKVGVDGTITTVAGTGANGSAGDGSYATNAGIYKPVDVTVDNAGNLYIAELLGNRIRKVDSNGIISTVAGTGVAGYAGDGGAATATNAQINGVSSVCLDAGGNLLLADSLNNRIREVQNVNGSELLLYDTGSNSVGAYDVVVSNPYGSVTSSVANLSLLYPPTIVTNPGSVSLNLHGSSTLTVTAGGTAPFSYQWTLNGTNLLGAINSSYSITNLTLSSTGFYALVVSNPYGSVTSSAAGVQMIPSLTVPFVGTVGLWGQPTTLSVGAVGSGILNYQWYFNGSAIPGANSNTYSLSSLQFTNAGLYSVTVSSAYGSVSNAPYQVVVNPANVGIGTCPEVYISGTIGYSYTIQSSTDLANTNGWVTLTNITLTSPTQIWADTATDLTKSSNPKTFYRVIAGQ